MQLPKLRGRNNNDSQYNIAFSSGLELPPQPIDSGMRGKAIFRNQKKMNFAIPGLPKNEFNHWGSFSPSGSASGTSLFFLGQDSMASSNIGSVRSDRVGISS